MSNGCRTTWLRFRTRYGYCYPYLKIPYTASFLTVGLLMVCPGRYGKPLESPPGAFLLVGYTHSCTSERHNGVDISSLEGWVNAAEESYRYRNTCGKTDTPEFDYGV